MVKSLVLAEHYPEVVDVRQLLLPLEPGHSGRIRRQLGILPDERHTPGIDGSGGSKLSKACTEEIRDYVLKSSLDLKSLLKTVTQKTKVKLARHVKELVLTPAKRDGEGVYEVSGEWELLPEKKCVILVVARDGIEPPTRGFSVRCSTS
jgi:hypothetical protein